MPARREPVSEPGPGPVSESVLLRPATADDLPVVGDLYLRSRAAAVPAMPATTHTDDEVHAWVSGWDLDDQDVWVAEDDDVLLGYARVHGAWLDDLYVAPEAAGRGIGSALLDLVRSRSPGGFCLWVFESNAPARGFYARRGFIELECTDGSANEERAPDIRMAWPGVDPLTFLRGLIDDVDEQLGDLLARRAALTRAVQPHKAGAGRDPERERAIAAQLAHRAPALGVTRLSRIVDVIVAESLDAATHD